MIARVGLRLRRELLRAQMRGAVRREAAKRAVDALARQEAEAAIPDEKLTTVERVNALSRIV